MKLITVKPTLNDQEVKSLEGKFINESYIKNKIIKEDTIVKTDKGKLLLVFKKNAVPQKVLEESRSAFRKAVGSGSNNRGMASGNVPDIFKVGDKIGTRTIGKITKNRWYPLLPNGKLSKTSYGITVKSNTIGFNDRYPRIPYCRTTAFTQKNLQLYKKTLPYIYCVDQVYKNYAPDNYKLQKKLTEITNKDFIIENTTFTTVTVNKNYRTACHYDAGDYKKGFGNLGVLRKGNYSGGYTVIPKYGIGIDLYDGDVALFDVHELHGNTEIKRKAISERISVVCYYRENMIFCGSKEYELERAKKGLKNKYTTEEKNKANDLIKKYEL